MSDAPEMRDFAMHKTQELLDELVFAIHNAARLHDAESVHKLRTSIRRFQQALRVFRQYFPETAAAKIKKQLKQAMKCAGEVRNRDIALELIAKQGASAPEIEAQRNSAKRQLLLVLREITARDISLRWRAMLQLAAA
jgi:CHAD domain-containing protein